MAVDPAKAVVRGRPKSQEDLAISVSGAWVPVFDNLSRLDQEMSDWLCRLSEGGAFPKRKLYSDTDEILIEASRLIVLTAIPDIARSADLIDRSVLVVCDPLATKLRERVLLTRFEAFHPRLLWFLIEAAVCALGRLAAMAETHDGLRRGDFVAWVEAAAPALGIEEGRFTAAYQRNQNTAVLLALETDPVARALLGYMESKRVVEMSATLLLSELAPLARKNHGGQLPLGRPSLAHHFSSRLRRLAPNLRRIGCDVPQEHRRTGSLVRVVTRDEGDVVPPDASEAKDRRASPASPKTENHEERDARDARDALWGRGTKRRGGYRSPSGSVTPGPAHDAPGIDETSTEGCDDGDRACSQGRDGEGYDDASAPARGGRVAGEAQGPTSGRHGLGLPLVPTDDVPAQCGGGGRLHDEAADDTASTGDPDTTGLESREFLACSNCNGLFPRPPRGRPPSRCPACRNHQPAANGEAAPEKTAWTAPTAPEDTSRKDRIKGARGGTKRGIEL
jgi:hypothetical protein